MQLLRKPYLMVFLFLDPIVFCTRPFLELVVRALCVCFSFLNIYFFNMLSTCHKNKADKKGQCLKIVDFFLGIIYIISTLY